MVSRPTCRRVIRECPLMTANAVARRRKAGTQRIGRSARSTSRSRSGRRTWAVDSTEPPGKVDGFVPETSREVPELGGPQRQVFENADGTTTVRHFTGRQLFQTSGQGWRRIDPTLVQQDNGEGWRSRADSEAKRFARSANARQLVAVELEGGQSYGFGVSGAKGSIGTVVGDTATYPNVPPARIWYCRRLRAGSRKRSFSSPRMRRRSGTSP